jgi:hypothetical protein
MQVRRPLSPCGRVERVPIPAETGSRGTPEGQAPLRTERATASGSRLRALGGREPSRPPRLRWRYLGQVLRRPRPRPRRARSAGVPPPRISEKPTLKAQPVLFTPATVDCGTCRRNHGRSCSLQIVLCRPPAPFSPATARSPPSSGGERRAQYPPPARAPGESRIP